MTFFKNYGFKEKGDNVHCDFYTKAYSHILKVNDGKIKWL